MSSNVQNYYSNIFSKACGWYGRFVRWYWVDILWESMCALSLWAFVIAFTITLALSVHIITGVVTLIIALVLSIYVIFSWPFVLLYYKRHNHIVNKI